MTIAYWCVLLVVLLPLVWASVAKFGVKGYDNRHPRPFMEKHLTGIHQRANWAQANSYESFPPFAAAVIICHLVGVSQGLIDGLAIVFLFARIGHGVAYIKDKATIRSIVWTIGFFCVVGLFLAAGWA